MRAEHSHHFNLNPDFMARAAGNDGNRSPKEKTADSHYGKSEQELILGYKNNIAILREFTDKKPGSTQGKNLEKFAELVESGITKDFTNEILASYKTVVFDDLSMVCNLAIDADLPEDIRKETIEELTTHLDVCAPGMAQHIEEAARKLQVLKNGLPQNFIHQLISVINAEITDYIDKNNICEYIGNEIHYIAAFFNYIAPSFGLPPRSDPFSPDISERYLNEFAQHLHDKAIIDRAIEVMAEDCRNQIIELYAKDHPNLQSVPMEIEEYGEVNIKFHNAVQPKIELAFGHILSSDIFSAFYENSEDENEKYRLTIDNSLLAHSIARNLRAVDSITFDADYLAGEKGPGAKLKISGEKTVYVSTTDNSKNHHHQILEEFIWQNDLQAKALLDQLNTKATEKTEVKNIQDDILQKISHTAAKRISQATDVNNAKNILDESVALLWSDPAKETLLAISLAQALREGKPEISQVILAMMGAPHLGDKDDNGNTALHIAAMRGYLEVANTLVEKMSAEQLSNKNNRGQDCATIARERGLDELHGVIIQKIAQQKTIDSQQGQLLEQLGQSLKSEDPQEAGKHIEQMLPMTFGKTDKNGDIALMLAMYSDRPDIAKTVFPHMSQAHFGIKNSEGFTALVTAIQQFYPEFTQGISEKMSPQQLGLQNNNGDTALMLALKMEDARSVDILLAQTSQEQLGISNIDGDTPLMLALKHNNPEIAELIADRMSQQQLDLRNNAGNTALSIALNLNQSAMAEAIGKKMDVNSLTERHHILLQNLQKKLHTFEGGLSVIHRMLTPHLGIKNSQGDTALLMALRKNQEDSSLALIAKMTPEQLGITDKNGSTALMLALQFGEKKIAMALMEKMPKEQLEICNRDGTCALMLALENSQNDICQHIIDNVSQSHFGLQDKLGNTALMIAQRFQKNDIQLAIVEKMTKEQLEISNVFGTTAFITAKRNKQTEMCRSIVKKINPPVPGFFNRIQLFFMNMISEAYQPASTRAKLAKFYWY